MLPTFTGRPRMSRYDDDHDDRDDNDHDDRNDNGIERDDDERDNNSSDASMDSSEVYRFSVQGNSVTGVQEYDDGYWQAERIDSNETYTVDGKYIVKTEIERYGTEISRYLDADGDGIYAEVSSSGSTFDDSSRYDYADNGSRRYEQYKFVISNGAVTEIYETDDGRLQRDYPDWNETYSIDGTDVVKTETEYYGAEVTRYQDLDGDGYYTEVSYGWIPRTQAATLSAEQLLNVSNTSQNQVGTALDDDLTGSDGDDYLFSGDGDDVVDGLDGDDLIVGGSGAGDDIYRGGNGSDTAKYTSATNAIKVDLAAGSARGSDIDRDSLSSIENVIGGLGNDKLIGDAMANVLNGEAGNDKIVGAGGDDVLIGGQGIDQLTGGLGADTFKFESLEELGSGAGRDRIKDFSGAQGDRIDLSSLDLALTFYTSLDSGSDRTGAVWFEKGLLKISNDADVSAEYEIALTGVSVFDESYLIA